MGKKSSCHWVNRQGNTEHEVIISARDTNESLPGIHCATPVASKDNGGVSEKSGRAISPREHLHSRERPKELGLFISETTLSGYLITALKYLSRERRSETR